MGRKICNVRQDVTYAVKEGNALKLPKGKIVISAKGNHGKH